MTDLEKAAREVLVILEVEEAQTHYPTPLLLKAINILRQALANEALNKMAENAREIGLDYGSEQPVVERLRPDDTEGGEL